MKPEAFEDKAPKNSDLSLQELEKKLSAFEDKIEGAIGEGRSASKSLPKSKTVSAPVFEKEPLFSLADLKARMEQIENQLKKETEPSAASNSAEVENKLRDLESQIQTLHIDFKKALAREPRPAVSRVPEAPKKSAVLSVFSGLVTGFVVAAAVWTASLFFPALKPWVLGAAQQVREFFHREEAEVSPVPPANLEEVKVREREFKMINALLFYMERNDSPQVRAKSAELLRSWPWKGVPEHLLMVARQDSDATVTRNALASFSAITGYRGDKNWEAAQQWWQENQAAVNVKLIG